MRARGAAALAALLALAGCDSGQLKEPSLPPPHLISGPIDLPAACSTRPQAPDHPGEPSLAVDPVDPGEPVAAWQENRSADDVGIVVAVSHDGGTSWTRAALPSVLACTGGLYVHAGDPWVSIGRDGVVYVSALVVRPRTAAGTTRDIVVSISRDHGATWERPAVVESATMPPSCASSARTSSRPRRATRSTWPGSRTTPTSRPSWSPGRKMPAATGAQRRWWCGRNPKHSFQPWRWPVMQPSACCGLTFATLSRAAHGSIPTSGSAPHAIGARTAFTAMPPGPPTSAPPPEAISGPSAVITCVWSDCRMDLVPSSFRLDRKAATGRPMSSSRVSWGRHEIEAYSRPRCCPSDAIEIPEAEAMAGTGTKATSEQKRARIRKSYDLSAKGDYEGSVQAAWADNGVFHSQMRGREFRGKAAIRDEVKKQNQEVKTTWHVHDV